MLAKAMVQGDGTLTKHTRLCFSLPEQDGGTMAEPPLMFKPGEKTLHTLFSLRYIDTYLSQHYTATCLLPVLYRLTVYQQLPGYKEVPHCPHPSVQ